MMTLKVYDNLKNISHNSSSSIIWQALICIVTATIYWIFVCLAMRYTLKLLLMYKGWMYESRGSGSRASLKTKAWAGLVKGNFHFLFLNSPNFFLHLSVQNVEQPGTL